MAVEVVAELHDADAVLLARHGALTTGSDPLRALFRMESLEQAAKTMLAARLLQL